MKQAELIKYLFTVQGFYYGQWEDETTEETRAEALHRLKEYRINMPEYIHRLVKTKEETERVAKCKNIL